MSRTLYGYYINLHERGEFYADVRNSKGDTVYEIFHGRDDPDAEDSSIIEDGYMKDVHDTEGLTEYLRSLQIIESEAEVLPSASFESALEADEEEEDALLSQGM